MQEARKDRDREVSGARCYSATSQGGQHEGVGGWKEQKKKEGGFRKIDNGPNPHRLHNV